MYWKSSPQNVLDHVRELGVTYIVLERSSPQNVLDHVTELGVTYIGKKFATERIRSHNRTRDDIKKKVSHKTSQFPRTIGMI